MNDFVQSLLERVSGSPVDEVRPQLPSRFEPFPASIESSQEEPWEEDLLVPSPPASVPAEPVAPSRSESVSSTMSIAAPPTERPIHSPSTNPWTGIPLDWQVSAPPPLIERAPLSDHVELDDAERPSTGKLPSTTIEVRDRTPAVSWKQEVVATGAGHDVPPELLARLADLDGRVAFLNSRPEVESRESPAVDLAREPVSLLAPPTISDRPVPPLPASDDLQRSLAALQGRMTMFEQNSRSGGPDIHSVPAELPAVPLPPAIPEPLPPWREEANLGSRLAELEEQLSSHVRRPTSALPDFVGHSASLPHPPPSTPDDPGRGPAPNSTASVRDEARLSDELLRRLANLRPSPAVDPGGTPPPRLRSDPPRLSDADSLRERSLRREFGHLTGEVDTLRNELAVLRPPAGRPAAPLRATLGSAAAPRPPLPLDPSPVQSGPGSAASIRSAVAPDRPPVPPIPRIEALTAERPAPARTLTISIGRIEIRSPAAAPAPPSPVRPERRPSRVMSLDDYLRQRDGAGGGP